MAIDSGRTTPNAMSAMQLQLQSALRRIEKLEAANADQNAAIQPAIPTVVGGGVQVVTPTLTISQGASTVTAANAINYAFVDPTIPFDTAL